MSKNPRSVGQSPLEPNTARPHQAIAWNRPLDVHTGLADPLIPNSPDTENLPAA